MKNLHYGCKKLHQTGNTDEILFFVLSQKWQCKRELSPVKISIELSKQKSN